VLQNPSRKVHLPSHTTFGLQGHYVWVTGWQRTNACHVFISHFPQHSHVISGSFDDKEDDDKEDDEDDEDEDEDEDEDDDEDEDEEKDCGKKKTIANKNVKTFKKAKVNAAVEVAKALLAVKNAKKDKKVKMPVKARFVKEVAAQKRKAVCESSGDDSDASILSSESEMEEDGAIVVEKKKMASKKTDAKIAPKSSTIAQMQ